MLRLLLKSDGRASTPVSEKGRRKFFRRLGINGWWLCLIVLSCQAVKDVVPLTEPDRHRRPAESPAAEPQVISGQDACANAPPHTQLQIFHRQTRLPMDPRIGSYIGGPHLTQIHFCGLA